ncbi:GIY-YIG nuclease family protein [Microaceticoccus formicicus]|uniref:GIY-YIG nuclease family protein n=1 Tax=Microaceticoccus formicicus TaxID=3118105 RepID=UPI003CD01C4F|nr:GIY-YIG nuclease family protein [Peptoniphilaceae bacterium AMB_02]
MKYYVYILNCSDNTYYTGITNNLLERIKVHNEGKASKYTRGRIPVEYVYIEEVLDKSEALKREIAIKKLPRPKKLDLINQNTDKLEKYNKSAD